MYILAATILLFQHCHLLRLRTVCNIIRNLCTFFWIIIFPVFFGRFAPSGCNLLRNILQPSSRYIATFSPTFCNLLPIILQPLSPHFLSYFNLLPNSLQPSFHCIATFSQLFCNLLPCILQPFSHHMTTFFVAICNLLSIVFAIFFPSYCKSLYFTNKKFPLIGDQV